MRLAVFIKGTTFHDGYGGLETQNKVLCEGLVKRGHEVVVFSPQWNLDKEEEFLNGVKYYFVPCVYRLAFSSMSSKNWAQRSFEMFLHHHYQKPFEIILSQSSAGIGVIRNKSEIEDIKIVAVAHGSIMGEMKTRYQSIAGLKDILKLFPDTAFALNVFFGRQRDFVHGSDKIIAVSNAVKKALMDETYVDESKVEVIFNGVDASAIVSTEFLQRNNGILYIGQITKSKGVDILPKLLLDEALSNVRMDVVGDGAYLQQLKRNVKKYHLEEQFFVYGKLPYDEVLNIYRSPDVGIFVFPTRRFEGFPMVLAEAMLAGLPIVAFDVGGVGDAVVDGETGCLVSPGNYARFRECLLELATNKELRASMGEKARKRAQENFTEEAMVGKYENLLKGQLQ